MHVSYYVVSAQQGVILSSCKGTISHDNLTHYPAEVLYCVCLAEGPDAASLCETCHVFGQCTCEACSIRCKLY